MNRSKYNLYNKVIDLNGIDDVLQGFHEYLTELIFLGMSFNEPRSEKTEKEWIEKIAGLKIMIEMLVLYLKQRNKDQILWTEMHAKLDRLKKMIESEERKREDNG